MQKTEFGEDILNVGELIELLENLPKDALVWHEGCDCYGSADGIEHDKKDNSIVITRSN